MANAGDSRCVISRKGQVNNMCHKRCSYDFLADHLDEIIDTPRFMNQFNDEEALI